MASKEYESFVSDLLSSIAEMRLTGDYDENTLETLEWRFSAPSNRVVCPNGEGDPFSCTPFCALCEGEGEIEKAGE